MDPCKIIKNAVLVSNVTL